MTEKAKPEQTSVNASGTSAPADASVTRGRSGSVLYELIDKDGKTYHMQFTSALGAADFARRMWPDQEQDEDRTGNGWNVQVVGS